MQEELGRQIVAITFDRDGNLVAARVDGSIWQYSWMSLKNGATGNSWTKIVDRETAATP